MRADRPQDRVFARGVGLVLALAGFVSGASGFGAKGAAAGLALGGLLAGAVHKYAGRRSARRRAHLAAPFPDRWREYTDVWHQQVKDWLGSYFCHEILPITPRRKDARGSVLMNPCVLNDFLANPAAVGIFQKMFSSSLPAFKILLLNSDFSSKFLGTIISLDF